MANDHRLSIDPATDVVSWIAFGAVLGTTTVLVCTRATAVVEWKTVDQVVIIGSGMSAIGIDSATDVISWDNVN